MPLNEKQQKEIRALHERLMQAGFYGEEGLEETVNWMAGLILRLNQDFESLATRVAELERNVER